MELIRIEQENLVIIDKLFQNRSVEPFHIAFMLRVLRLGMPLILCNLRSFSAKCFMNSEPLSAVTEQVGKDFGRNFEELSGRTGSMTLGCPGKSEPGIVIAAAREMMCELEGMCCLTAAPNVTLRD